MTADCPTTLYRHFASDGALLYVGISLSWPARTKAHASGSRWFELVAKVEIERFPSRTAALEAEREAIKRERPKFNVIHNRGAEKAVEPKRKRREIDPSDPCRFLSARERRRYEQQRDHNPLLKKIKGPHAIVGPALVYRDDKISVLVAHGTFGRAGAVTELVLGTRFPDLPEWTRVCDSVQTIRRPDEITLAEARGRRFDVVKTLRAHLADVHSFDTDLAFAVAYAAQFPSDESRRMLDAVASEKGARA